MITFCLRFVEDTRSEFSNCGHSEMKKNIVCLLLITFLATACSNDEISITDISVAISLEDNTTIDINKAIGNATEEVDRILPGARLNFFSFTGRCQKLSDFHGEIFLSFTQTRWTLFGQRVFLARAYLDTMQESMEISIRDETEYYWNTDLLTFEGKPIGEIASIVTEYLSSTNRCNSLVVLNKSSVEGPWGVRCGAPEEVFIHCIEIDPITGMVIELHR